MINGERGDFLLLPVRKNGKEGGAPPVKRLTGLLAAGLLLLAPARPLFSGIATPFAEIRVRNLQIGHTYVGSREVTPNMPYTARNKTDSPLNFTAEASVPNADQLVAGYEPIPDPSWITFARDFFSAPPQQSGTTEYFISIPDDEKHLGKNYQVQLMVRTFGAGFMQMGLVGRALLSINAEKGVPAPDHQLAVKFHPEPAGVELKDVKVGKKTSFADLFGTELTVVNDSDYALECRVEGDVLDESVVMAPKGYAPAPSLKFMKVKSRKLTVPARGKAAVEGFVRIPNKPEHKGKSYYFILKISTLSDVAKVDRFVRLFLQTEK